MTPPAKNARVDYTGETIGFLRVIERIGPWRGKRATEYLCETICCGTQEIRLHRLLTEWRADAHASGQTQCPVCGKRRAAGGRELALTRHSHEGQTYGWAQVGAQLGEWSGHMHTEYRVTRLCCGKSVLMTHTELSRMRRDRPDRCRDCVAAAANMLTPEERAAGGHGQVLAEQRERMGLIEARELERKQMLERVDARRAQARAAQAAHHERVCGRVPTGRPDWAATLDQGR